jgi:hypothetical protein
VVVKGRVQVGRVQVRVEPCLLALPLVVDEVRGEHLLLLQHGAAVVQLLLALLALLAHEHLELAQLLPCHLLGVVGVVAHE